MRFDAQLVKDSVSIKELFERDGHVLHKCGPDDWKCKCPFHAEKTASCHVHPERQFFKCFGCGEGGDIYKYWELTRHLQFAEAIVELGKQGAGTWEQGTPQLESRKAKVEDVETPAPAMSEVLESWTKAVERLRDLPERMEQMAKWRGYSIETVKWANNQGLLGLVPMFGVW